MTLGIAAFLALFLAFGYFFAESISKQEKIDRLEKGVLSDRINEYYNCRANEWASSFYKSSEKEIARFKKILHRLGYYNSEINGIEDQNFKNSVCLWAKENNEDFINNRYFGPTHPEYYGHYLANFYLKYTVYGEEGFYDHLYDKDACLKSFSEKQWEEFPEKRYRKKIRVELPAN